MQLNQRLCYNIDVMNNKITSFFICLGKTKAIFLMLTMIFIFSNTDSLLTHAKEHEEAGSYRNEIIIKYHNNTELKYVKVAGDIKEALKQYNALSAVEYAEPNYLYQASIIPSDTYYSNQWYLKKIKAPEAWDIVRESEEIVIAILDSGVQIDHPDLSDNIWRNQGEIPGNNIDDDNNGYIDDVNGWNFVNGVSDPSPAFEQGFTADGILHGTIVAGVAAASGNNGIGISGVTWKAKIMALKVLDNQGSGDTINVVQAIDYAIKNNADIINFSFVGYGNSQSLENAIRRAYQSGIILVAAAGNDQGEGEGVNTEETLIYPACHDGLAHENMVIGVSATDALDQKANFSGFGHNCVDIAAPGVSIFSTTVNAPGESFENKQFTNYYDGYWSGTSMAAPMVSGAIALIEAVNPSLGYREVKDILLSTTDNIFRLNPEYLNKLGSGRLNVYEAVKKAKSELANKELRLLFAPYSEKAGEIKISDFKGNVVNKFLAYSEVFKGGAYVATGDVDGDGNQEIISGAGYGGGPQVRIFDYSGKVKAQFFAYDRNFRGGVHVAIGDVDGDGKEEIITGAGYGGGPHIRIFNDQGDLLRQFFAYDRNFCGGVHVAIGDVDGDGKEEIITGAGYGGGPQVRIFDYSGKVEGQFFAYDRNFRGGVRVAAARISQGSGGKANIITAPGLGGGPHIKVFDNQARIKSQFFAYDKNFHGGVQIAAADVDYDGLDEIITGAGPGGTPHLRVFENNGTLLYSFFALEEEFDGGINVSAIELKK